MTDTDTDTDTDTNTDLELNAGPPRSGPGGPGVTSGVRPPM